MLLHKGKQLPEIRVKNRIASGNVKVRDSAIHLTKIKAVIKSFQHLFPIHRSRFFASIFREYITMLATLVTVIGDMPPKRKILVHLQAPFMSGVYFQNK